MKKPALLLLVACIWTLSSHAQFKYLSNGKLTFGNVTPFGTYTTHIEGWGHYFTNGSYFLEFCLGVSSPRIAGSGNQVVFYNTETSTFNSIQVASVLNYSDGNSKTNIAPISYGLQTVMKLKPVTYDWKQSGNGVKNLTTGVTPPNIGFISQDVEDVLPQLVYTDPEGKKLMNYIGIIPILTKSIQELSAEVNSLKAEVERLKTIVVANGNGNGIALINSSMKASK